MERPCSARDSNATVPSGLDTTRPFLPVIYGCGGGRGQVVSWYGHPGAGPHGPQFPHLSRHLAPGAPGCGWVVGAARTWPLPRLGYPWGGQQALSLHLPESFYCNPIIRGQDRSEVAPGPVLGKRTGTQWKRGRGGSGVGPGQHCLNGRAGYWTKQPHPTHPPPPNWPPGGTRTHLGHTLWAPQLIDELVQGVDWQLPAQRLHLGQQVLLQPLNPLQDPGAVQVPLWGAQGACGAGGSGGTGPGRLSTALLPAMGPQGTPGCPCSCAPDFLLRA